MFLIIVAGLIMVIGFYAMVSPVKAAEKIAAFYRNYPLIRYASAPQFQARRSLLRLLGLVFILVSAIGIYSVASAP